MQGTEGTDARSDLYSLAATVYHLLTGSAPPGPLARVGKITDRLPDPLQSPEQINSDVPADVGAVLLKAMSLSRDVNPSLALSADGNTVAIGTTNEKVVRLFDTRSGKPGRQFPEHSEGTLSLAFAPNGFVLAVGSYDGRITLWNFVTGEWIRSVVQPDLDAPFSVAFNPAATILAAGSYNEVRTWVSKTSVPIQTYDSGDAGTAYSVSFSPDGTLLAAGFDGGQIRLFRIE